MLFCGVKPESDFQDVPESVSTNGVADPARGYTTFFPGKLTLRGNSAEQTVLDSGFRAGG
jgi:hypothetical protein